MAEDLYQILGVKKDSNDNEIKSAYRKLAKEWHPDKHKSDKTVEEKFKKINLAYEILSDKKKRQQYDTFGATGGMGSGFGGANRSGFEGFSGFGGFQGGGNAQGFDFSDFSTGVGDFADIFETFFSGGRSGGGSRSRKKSEALRGNDIEADIKISFEEAVFGCEKDLEITKSDKCPNCNGKGYEADTPIITCKECGGSGEIRAVRNTILGQISTSRTCDECGGEGKIPEKKCSVCHGTTRVRTREHVKIRIPAGVDNGSTVRINEKGEAGIKGGPNGDLFINLRVEQSKKFLRMGFDIHSENEISIAQAVLGGEIGIETLYGTAKIKIPAGTSDGKVFKISGRGVPKVRGGGNGDHLVKIKIKIPAKLTKREKELYSLLAEEEGLDIKKGGLFW